VSCHGFHPLKARQLWSITLTRCVHPKGPTPTYEDIKDLDDLTAAEWMRDAENSRHPDGAYKLVMPKKHTWEPLASFLDETQQGVHDREKERLLC
jgi:hypothetical protein